MKRPLVGVGSVVKYVNEVKVSPKHGLTEHLGGRCCRCQHDGLVAQGLVKP